MDERKIQRINELAKKAKTVQGLTPEEKEEQALLRREYLDAVRGKLGGPPGKTHPSGPGGGPDRVEKGEK